MRSTKDFGLMAARRELRSFIVRLGIDRYEVMERIARKENSIAHLIGHLTLYLSISFIIPLLVSVHYQEDVRPWVFPLVLTACIGMGLVLRFRSSDHIRPVEAMFLVTMVWLLVMVFGAVPYVMYGMGVVDALFETMSGFTTTGSTIMTDIESWPKSLLFWRSLTQWLGGAGIILIFVTVLPMLGVGGRNLTKNELPGGLDVQRFSLRIKDEVRKFHYIYLGLSALLVLILVLTRMSLYDALTVTFSTMSTGGLSPYRDSISHFDSALVEWILIIFMFLAATNFYLHFQTLTSHKLRTYWNSTEFRTYALMIIGAIALTMVFIWDGSWSVFETDLRTAAFQIVSVTTTTGFSTADFTLWDRAAVFLIFALMIVGGCTGSTSGGIKVARFLLSWRFIQSILYKAVHPRAIFTIKLDGRPLREEATVSLIAIIICYFLTALVSTVALILMDVDPSTAMSASITTLSNAGPGLGVLGPSGSFSSLPDLAKVVLTITMWVGRLEFISVFVILTPVFWTELLRHREDRNQ